jgi:alpha-beta hydrolase superfamily lysophospholipase
VSRIVLIGLLAAVGALIFQLAIAPRLSAQSPDRTFGYVLLLGADTIGVERVTVKDRVWTGDAISQGQGRLVWQATEVAPGTFSAIEFSAYRTNTDENPMQRATLGMDGDSAVLTLIIPTAGERRLPSKRGAKVLFNSSFAQIALFSSGRAPGARDSIMVMLANGGVTMPAFISRDGDTTRFVLAGTEIRFYHDASGAIGNGEIASQGLRIMRVEGNALAAVTIGKPTYDAPAGAPYRAEQVTIPVGPHTLAATFTRPATGDGPFPVVVTISGSGGQDRDEYIPVAGGYRPFRQLADTLGRQGIAVLRFDDRGVGASTGNYAAATTLDFAEDVRAVVRYLRGRPDVASEKIILLGHSEGGIVAPMVASGDPRIRGVVLMAGSAQTGRQIIHFQQDFMLANDTTLRTPAARDSARAVARAQLVETAEDNPWIKFFLDYDPLPTAARVKVPALILNGETDRQVTAEQAAALGAAMTAAGNTDVTVRVFPKLNHLFLVDPDGDPTKYARLPNGKLAPEVTALLVTWILEKTR